MHSGGPGQRCLPGHQRAARRLRARRPLAPGRHQGRGPPRALSALHGRLPRAERGQLLARRDARARRCSAAQRRRYLGGGAAGAGLGAGALVLLGRGKDFVLANAPASAATAAVVGVAGVTAIAVVNRGPGRTADSRGAVGAGTGLPSFATVLGRRTPSRSSHPGRSHSGQSVRVRPPPSRTRSPARPAHSAPTPAAAPLLDSADEQLARPTGRAGRPCVRPGAGRNTPSRATGQVRAEIQARADEARAGRDPTRSPPPSRLPSPRPSRAQTDPDAAPEPPGPRADVGVTAGQASEHHGRVDGLGQGDRRTRRQAGQAHRHGQHREASATARAACSPVRPRLHLHRHSLAQRVRLPRQRELAARR